jgi:hypothetical protein
MGRKRLRREEVQENPVSIAILQVEIRNLDLPNTNQEC